jgi:hypothetical protein
LVEQAAKAGEVLTKGCQSLVTRASLPRHALVDTEGAFGKMPGLLSLDDQRGSRPHVPQDARTKLLFYQHYHRLKSGHEPGGGWNVMVFCDSDISADQAVWL